MSEQEKTDAPLFERVCDMSSEWFAQEVSDEVAAWSETYDLGTSAPPLVARRAAGIPPSDDDDVIEVEEKLGIAHGEVLGYEDVTEQSFVCYLLGREGERFLVELPDDVLGTVRIRKIDGGDAHEIENHPSEVARFVLGLKDGMTKRS